MYPYLKYLWLKFGKDPAKTNGVTAVFVFLYMKCMYICVYMYSVAYIH